MRVQPTILGDPHKPLDITRWSERLARGINGNLSYGSTMSNKDADINLSIWKATGTAPGAPNTDFTITHHLGRIPITIVGQDTNNGGLLYRSPVTPWTKTTITLRCTVASSVYNLIVS